MSTLSQNSSNVNTEKHYYSNLQRILADYPTNVKVTGRAWGSVLTKDQVRECLQNVIAKDVEGKLIGFGVYNFLCYILHIQNTETGQANMGLEKLAIRNAVAVSSIKKWKAQAIEKFNQFIDNIQYRPTPFISRCQTFIYWDALLVHLQDEVRKLLDNPTWNIENSVNGPLTKMLRKASIDEGVHEVDHRKSMRTPSEQLRTEQLRSSNCIIYKSVDSGSRPHSTVFEKSDVKQQGNIPSRESKSAESCNKEAVHNNNNKPQRGFADAPPRDLQADAPAVNTFCNNTLTGDNDMGDHEDRSNKFKNRMNAINFNNFKSLSKFAKANEGQGVPEPEGWNVDKDNATSSDDGQPQSEKYVPLMTWEERQRVLFKRKVSPFRDGTNLAQRIQEEEEMKAPMTPERSRNIRVDDLESRHPNYQEILDKYDIDLPELKWRMRQNLDYDPFNGKDYWNPNCHAKYACMSEERRLEEFIDYVHLWFDTARRPGSSTKKSRILLASAMKKADEMRADYNEYLIAHMNYFEANTPIGKGIYFNHLNSKISKRIFDEYVKNGRPNPLPASMKGSSVIGKNSEFTKQKRQEAKRRFLNQDPGETQKQSMKKFLDDVKESKALIMNWKNKSN